MNGVGRGRRQSCTAVVLVILLQQLWLFPTTTRAAELGPVLLDNSDIDYCTALCARENHPFTGNNAQELQQQQPKHHYQCACNNEARQLASQQQQQEQPKHRIEDEESPGLVGESPDDFSPTASPTATVTDVGPEDNGGNTGIETTVSPKPSMAPLPSLPTTTPQPVQTTGAPILNEVPTVATPTESPRPTATPMMQPKEQIPSISPQPSVQKQPSSSEAPSAPMPMQNPSASPLLPNPSTETPTESPTFARKSEDNNDDYDGEKDYNDPSTEVTTPATTNSKNSDSDLSGGGKFGIVLLAGIVVGVLVVGYVTMQRRLRSSYRGSYSSTNGMNMRGAETELGLWESDTVRHRRGNDDDDGLL